MQAEVVGAVAGGVEGDKNGWRGDRGCVAGERWGATVVGVCAGRGVALVRAVRPPVMHKSGRCTVADRSSRGCGREVGVAVR